MQASSANLNESMGTKAAECDQGHEQQQPSSSQSKDNSDIDSTSRLQANASQLRKRNAIYSKRKYYKKKRDTERLELSKYELECSNQRLSVDNARLELLLQDARKKVHLQESMERLLVSACKQPAIQSLLPTPSYVPFQSSSSQHQGLLLSNTAGLIRQEGGVSRLFPTPLSRDDLNLIGSTVLAPATPATPAVPLISSLRVKGDLSGAFQDVGSATTVLGTPDQNDFLERVLRSQRAYLLRSTTGQNTTQDQLFRSELLNLQSGQLGNSDLAYSSLLASVLLQHNQREQANAASSRMLQEQRDMLLVLLAQQQQQSRTPQSSSTSHINNDIVLQYLLNRQQQH